MTLRLYFEDGGTVHYAYELNGQETLLDGSFPAAKSTWSGAKPHCLPAIPPTRRVGRAALAL